MENEVIYKAATIYDLKEIIALLNHCALPSKDIDPEKLPYFIVAKSEGRIVGTIGLEIYQKEALLRSMAVHSRYRNQGIANRLYKHVLQLAKRFKVNNLHLLTTTAESYFSKKGFKKANREFAPEAIRNTIEFAELCPSSSTYMVSITKAN